MKEVSPHRVKNEMYDYLFKVCLYGDAKVGKTATRLKFTQGLFDMEYTSTIGIDFEMKTVEMSRGDLVKLQLWDASGQKRFHSLTSSYYTRGAHGMVILFDLTNRETFNAVHQYIQAVEPDASNHLVTILVGTKSDLTEERVVSPNEFRDLAKEHGLQHIEVSAGNGHNVHGLFEILIEQMIQAKRKSSDTSVPTDSVSIPPSSRKACSIL